MQIGWYFETELTPYQEPIQRGLSRQRIVMKRGLRSISHFSQRHTAGAESPGAQVSDGISFCKGECDGEGQKADAEVGGVRVGFLDTKDSFFYFP